MDYWIIATFIAVTFQTARFVLQKVVLDLGLSSAGSTFSRFFYSAPIAWFGFLIYVTVATLPQVEEGFWAYVVAGGSTQILATLCIVELFKSRNFAVGVAFKKTEVLMTVLVGFILLSETVTPLALCAFILGIVGVLTISPPPLGQGGWRAMLWNRSILLGLLSGFLFAISGVTYRGASLLIQSDIPLERAGLTLVAVLTFQFLIMALWLALWEHGEMQRVWNARRSAMWIGVTSLGGSFAWFTAFTLQNAAYVNAVGQLEVVLSLVASVVLFKQRISPRELIGLGILTASIIILVLLA